MGKWIAEHEEAMIKKAKIKKSLSRWMNRALGTGFQGNFVCTRERLCVWIHAKRLWLYACAREIKV
jgi:hypothetical protein